MKLYQNPRSSNARKVVMTAQILGVPLELQTIDLAKGEQMKPEFLAINPMHAVPVLVDGDFALPESHAIMIHLCERTPGQELLPTEARARATVLRWMFWCSNHFSPPIGGLMFERVLKGLRGGGGADEAQVARHERALRPLAELLDAELARRAYVAGDSLTLADLAIAAPLMYAAPAQLPLDGLPHLAAWRERVEALPAWQETSGQ
ncbi:MAG: glutathione S-transferase family protein [Polyangiaceae bacterium]|nr:glutathione S-transferase family protein [Polyangiaceae bacterium]